MEEYTENQLHEQNPDAGRKRRRAGRSGFLPGVIIGILITVVVVGILFAVRGGSAGLLLGNGVFDLVDICKGAEGAVELLER